MSAQVPGARASEDVVRVLVVDDHPVFREGVRAALGADAGLDVVGAAADGPEALALAEDLQPDVVVMDLHLPELGGIEATRRIVATSPHIAVLVLTMLADEDSVFAAMRAGARGYLLKGATPEDTVRGVHAVARGEAVFGPGIADRMLAFFTASPGRRSAPVLPQLTEREREVLELIAGGARNSEIGARLVISPKTVRNHISNIFTKLQVADRAEAIAVARSAGLSPDD
jgi:DNA-binding NarL/FixJ family response regulator